MIFRYLGNPIPLPIGIEPTLAEGILCVVAMILALLFALSIHEFAHAFVAHKCGDDTAKLSGRMTVNPIKHLDFLGAIMLMLVGFGWAKPVPVDYRHLKHQKRDAIFVSLAGIVFNVIFAFIFTGLYMIVGRYLVTDALLDNRFVYLLVYLLYCFLNFSVMLNLGLALFNILPLYPLDGFRVLEAFAPNSAVTRFLIKYSLWIFLLIIVLDYLPFSPFSWYVNTVEGLLLRVFFAFWGLFI